MVVQPQCKAIYQKDIKLPLMSQDGGQFEGLLDSFPTGFGPGLLVFPDALAHLFVNCKARGDKGSRAREGFSSDPRVFAFSASRSACYQDQSSHVSYFFDEYRQ